MRSVEIWSGGQTGADRAAFDAALELGFAIRGWIPRGRRAEDGAISLSYPNLQETVSDDYDDRTARNVRDTDATLILGFGPLVGGTARTAQVARELGRPMLVLDLRSTDVEVAANAITRWLDSDTAIARLNVAGPRASQAPQLYELGRAVLRQALGASNA